jgi:hypothetical protein
MVVSFIVGGIWRKTLTNFIPQTNNIFTVSIKSSTRQNDPVKMILLAAIEYVEHIFNSEKGMYIGNKSNSITCIDVKHIAHSM